MATTLALWQWREAERQRAIAVARLLATRAEQLLDSTDPRVIDRSALLAREALAQFDLPETQFVANKVLRLIGIPIRRMKSPSAVRGVKEPRDEVLPARRTTSVGDYFIERIRTGVP